MREKFVSKIFRRDTLTLIEQANQVLHEFASGGFAVSLRQLYYQFVAKNLIANETSEYKRLGAVIADARRAGLIDWDFIEDRTRELEAVVTWDNPEEIVAVAARTYREDLWREQSWRCEVWVEKSALAGVLRPSCTRWRIPSMAARDYLSISELHAAGKRIEQNYGDGQPTVIFYLGDHDPSGIDMGRNLTEALSLYARRPVEVVRLGLNLEQIRRLALPPNPAKESDRRYGSYVAETGCTESWELDALSPQFIDDLIEQAIRKRLDVSAWNTALTEEAANREKLNGWASARAGKIG
jgi:hypothetical protein